MEPVRVLCVCTHNRTRSIMIGGFLTRHMLDLGVAGVARAVGFDEPDQPVTSEVTRILAERGVNVGALRSRQITRMDVIRAQIIVTAERMHVVEIVGRYPDAFSKTMTLPEFVDRATLTSRGPDAGLEEWLEAITADRPHQLDYLDADQIGEIEDPTGDSPAAWRKCVERVDDLTRRMAALLASATIEAP